MIRFLLSLSEIYLAAGRAACNARAAMPSRVGRAEGGVPLPAAGGADKPPRQENPAYRLARVTIWVGLTNLSAISSQISVVTM